MRRRTVFFLSVFVILGLHTRCYAGCDCEDWVNRGGYCVDYVKARIPTFPFPKTHSEAAALKNKETANVMEGDAAVFDLGNYWHFAYVEKVHRDRHGNPIAIDVSEMNFGGPLSFNEYAGKWNSQNEGEWKRALCCGVTDTYEQTTVRKNITVNVIKQVWSPDSDGPEHTIGKLRLAVAEKVRDVINRFFEFAENVL